MKHNTKWIATLLATACGLAAGGLAQAQSISLSSIDGDSLTGYDGWLTATFTSQASGVEDLIPVAGGFGGVYFNLGAGATPINANSAYVTLSFTVNGDASPYIWLGVPLQLNDGSGQGTYPGVYSGYNNPGNPPNAVWTGNTASITFTLSGDQLANIQTGNAWLYGFSVGIDPAVVSVPTMDITFNSLTFSPAPVPEPTTLAVLGLGATGLLMLRRRK